MASIRRGIVGGAPALESASGFRRYVAQTPEDEAASEERRDPVTEPAARLTQDVPAGAAAAGEALRFRAALREAFEGEVQGLCADLAARVLARELRLAPADIEALARELLGHRTDEPVLALRAAPDDCPHLMGLAQSHGLDAQADPCLETGSVALDLRSGALESTLVLRLDEVLAAREVPAGGA